MTAYYNEFDTYAAQWLRNLIAADLIAPGDVDERSITDVRADELTGYTQCHFFAGIGVWSLALRLSGWPDDRPVWTGSCPCQPFSVAGKGEGTDDERHLWPAWFDLIRQRKPSVIFGEQVEAAIRHGWLDLVQADLEGSGYACGAVCLPVAGIGGPHIRNRLWFVADAECGAAERHGYEVGAAPGGMQSETREQRIWTDARDGGIAGQLANTIGTGLQGLSGNVDGATGRPESIGSVTEGGDIGGLGNSNIDRCDTGGETAEAARHWNPFEPASCRDSAGPVNGFWRDCDWILCRDEKWRPVEPGTFPLAARTPARMGQLRAYGNAISPFPASEVIKAFMEYRP